jgi:hypothetical protein
MDAMDDARIAANKTQRRCDVPEGEGDRVIVIKYNAFSSAFNFTIVYRTFVCEIMLRADILFSL